ncbi:MAG: DUF1501 domain-containing protein [Gemmataceae bacterium]|nr:DUF1501 domain-containing protein [Gemmataceae bacterium]
MSDIRIATRREFLVRGLGLVGVGATLPNFLIQTAASGAQARPGEKILVVLQLSGGHDGVSAVVPYSNEHYQRNRQATRITAAEALRIDDSFGLHPNLRGLKGLLDDGKFAAALGVSYPNPNRSHFTSMDIWHAADPARRTGHGWLGRYADHAFRGVRDPLLTLAIGGDRAPRALQGREHPGLSLGRSQEYRFAAGQRFPQLGEVYRQLNRQAAEATGGNASLQFVARTAVDANASSEAIQRLAQAGQGGGGTFPATRLGNSLQTVSNLIAGNLSTRVYYIFQGGFDTHANQRTRHNQLMTELNDALVAFQRDIEQRGYADRVLLMAFSEFGRTLRENRSQGTDHGTIGPMFLLGRGVRPGLHGRMPSMAPGDLVNREMVPTTDFRSVYATILERWLGTSSEAVLNQRFPLLDCVRA